MLKILLVSLFALCFQLPAARASHGGGMDSGGTDGLFVRLQKARDLSLEILTLVKADDLTPLSSDTAKFYQANRSSLIIEAASAAIEVKPANEVGLSVGGIFLPKKMVTGLVRGAPIYVSAALDTQSVLEIATFLLHEYGHHLGVSQTNDEFLDRLALSLTQKALENSPEFRAKTAACRTIEELYKAMAGRWVGVTLTRWTSPTSIDMIFTEDGHYSDRAACENEEKCRAPLYYDTSGASDEKFLKVENACGEYASGQISVTMSKPDSGVRMELRFLSLSPDGETLSFEFMHPKAIFPVVVKLKRAH